jgi:ATP-dependent Clp protease ATP-binding subunit ClpA
MGRPFGVLLLDEFEKAHAKVHDRFLQLIDEGSFINGMGETISCRSMIIIATTNCGAEVHRGEVFGFTDTGAGAIDRASAAALERQFRFELPNRFDRIVQFKPLTRVHVRAIAAETIARLPERNGMSQRKMTLRVDPEVIDFVVDKGFDVQRGARALGRTIEREVTAPVAAAVAGSRLPVGTCIHVSVADGRVLARPIGPTPPAEPSVSSDRSMPSERSSRSGTNDENRAAKSLRRALSTSPV